MEAYQITKKFYKNAKQEVVYLGFPANILQQILEIAKEKEISENETQIIISKCPAPVRCFHRTEF
jgi:glucose-6-phosphate 1-dehydrogenase